MFLAVPSIKTHIFGLKNSVFEPQKYFPITDGLRKDDDGGITRRRETDRVLLFAWCFVGARWLGAEREDVGSLVVGRKG